MVTEEDTLTGEFKSMNAPAHLLYSEHDLWVLMEGDIATLGVTDFAQSQLGDVIYVSLPSVGQTVTADGVMGSIESVKSDSDLVSPVSGVVLDTNTAVVEASEMVNQAPYDSWLVKVRVSGEPTAKLMNADEYLAYRG